MSSTLDDLRRRLARLPEVGARLAPLVAARFTSLARGAFDSGRSVYGTPFTSDTGGALDLNESGALRSQALRYSATGTKVRASVDSVRHARYQLKHGFLPGRALPLAWEQAAAEVIDAELEREASR